MKDQLSPNAISYLSKALNISETLATTVLAEIHRIEKNDCFPCVLPHEKPMNQCANWEILRTRPNLNELQALHAKARKLHHFFFSYEQDDKTGGLKVSLTPDFKDALENKHDFILADGTILWYYGDHIPTPFKADPLLKKCVTSYRGLFKGVTTERLFLFEWESSQVVDTSEMFKDSCIGEIMGFCSWDVDQLEDISDMFNGCETPRLNFTGWSVKNLLNAAGAFENSKIPVVEGLSKWKSDIPNQIKMFANCDASLMAVVAPWYEDYMPESL